MGGFIAYFFIMGMGIWGMVEEALHLHIGTFIVPVLLVEGLLLFAAAMAIGEAVEGH